jgi:hypothetical protein
LPEASTGGAFSQCGVYSKYLALQIKATELGLLPASGLREGGAEKRKPRGSQSGMANDRDAKFLFRLALDVGAPMLSARRRSAREQAPKSHR